MTQIVVLPHVELCPDGAVLEASPGTSICDSLLANGIDDLVDEGRRLWQEGAAAGDLAAMGARSRITESEALLDETGLGGFAALEWTVEATAS